MRPDRRFHTQASRLLLLTTAAALVLSASSRTTRHAAAIDQEKQEKEVKNPVANDPQAIKRGQNLFALSCGYCHGLDAHGGGRGPDLTSGRWTHGESDAALLQTITKGVPGTDMPSCNCPEEEAWELIAFLRSLSTNTATAVAGDREAGERIFFGAGGCAACHLVNGRGSRFGPDLSRIGAARSVRHLTESLRNPDKEIPDGYQAVVAVTKDGQRIAGVRKNEDTFSLQLMDQREQYHLFLKKDLREVIHQPKSLMPKYDERALGQKELEDLLAYLVSLRGQPKQ